MIEIVFEIIPFVVAALAMVVLRAGASQVFFDVVGSFQATRLIADAEAKVTVLQSLMLDGLSSIQESAGAISEQMTAVVDATVPLSREIAEARLEFEKFANFAGGDEVAGAIEKIGLAAGFSADQALNAGARMAQLSAIVGGGAGVAAATQTGIEFGLIGGMGTEDAMKRLISLQQQTNFMYGEMTSSQIARLSEDEKANVVRANSVKLMDELNTIENRSAATMSQITYVMNQYASSAQLAGDSTQFMAAMSATLIEAGEEQGKAGRALRMMYARLGANTGESAELLAKHGIAVKDDNDQLRSMEDILGDVSRSAIMNNKAEKMRVAQAIAGNDHYVRAIKLMDNYDRAMELSTQATQRLDTAQEELNRRYEDQAFQLTQAEAKLDNASARLGNHFIPGITSATNTLANLTNAMGALGEESEAVSLTLRAAAQVNAFGKIFAPLFEGMLNIMSLNVSLRTQQALLRAINGEEIVRANAYGQKAKMAATNMGMLAGELAARDREVTLSILSMKMRKEQLTIEQQAANLRNAELAGLDIIIAKETALRDRLQEQLNIEKAARVMQLTDPEKIQKARVKGSKVDMLRAELAVKKNITQEDALIAYYATKGLDAESGLMPFLTQKGTINKNILRNKEVAAFLDDHEVQTKKEIKSLAGQIGQAQMQANFAAKHDLGTQEGITTEIKEQLAFVQAQKAEKGKQILLSMQHAQMFSKETQEGAILVQAHMAATRAIFMKSNVQNQNKVVTDAMTTASIQLAEALGLEKQAIFDIIRTMPAFTGILGKIETQNQAVVASSMAASQSMMKLSIGLGAASMAFGMLSDNEDAAKISALLMTASMIPATVQMFQMTKNTIELAGSQAAASVTTKGLTASMKTLTKAAAPLVAIIAAVSIFTFATKNHLKEAEESFDDFANTVTYTAQQYEEAQTRMMGKDAASIASDVSGLNANILATEKDLANATDDTNKKVLQARLDLYLGERAILLDIMNLESSRGLLKDEASAQNIFNLGQELKAAEEAEAVAAKKANKSVIYNKHLGEIPTGFVGDFLGVQMGEVAYLQTFTDKTQEAFDAIPEQYQGAVADIAKNAKNFQDFMDELAEFSAESGEDFGAIFQNAADSMDDFIGPIEAAKEAIFEFNSEREEMFFGMSKGNLTGDMVKQVVNKGVETLINTTEVIMTNTFNGMTTSDAAKEITSQVISNLNSSGLNIKNNGMGF